MAYYFWDAGCLVSFYPGWVWFWIACLLTDIVVLMNSCATARSMGSVEARHLCGFCTYPGDVVHFAESCVFQFSAYAAAFDHRFGTWSFHGFWLVIEFLRSSAGTEFPIRTSFVDFG